MNCIQFEEKVQLLLDERLSLDSDSSLNQHARQCAECNQALKIYKRFSNLNHLGSKEVPPVPASLQSLVSIGDPADRSRPNVWRYATLAAALVLGFILISGPSRKSAPMAKADPIVGSQPSAPSENVDIENGENWTSPFAYEISIRDLIPEWTLQLSDAAYVDLPTIEELNFIALVPEGPVRAVQSIPNTLAPIYYYSVELPVVNRLSNRIYCTISLIQTSFGIHPNRLNTENDDLGLSHPLSWTHVC